MPFTFHSSVQFSHTYTATHPLSIRSLFTSHIILIAIEINCELCKVEKLKSEYEIDMF